jgi:hypothetical protein
MVNLPSDPSGEKENSTIDSKHQEGPYHIILIDRAYSHEE